MALSQFEVNFNTYYLTFVFLVEFEEGNTSHLLPSVGSEPIKK